MRVISNTDNNYAEDPIRYFDFKDYENIAKDCELYFGGWPHESIWQESTVPKYFFSTEEQSWDQDGTDQFVPVVDKIFTICPPKITNREKRQAVFFPMAKSIAPEQHEKKYDAIYTGYATGHHVETILNAITRFNYRFVSFEQRHGLVTDVAVSYPEKLRLIADSRACVVHNLTSSHTPQLKSRPFEAAFCQSLMLVKRDQWNILEEWFTPDVDFLYFDDADHLSVLIADSRYCDHIVKHAYERAMNEYTTEKFIEKYIGWK